jgi:nucleotide sugar dehydrogenase
MLTELKKKIQSRKAKIGIIGLGYVGLPLAVTFAKRGFKVFGIDIDKRRVEKLRKGESYILDVPQAELASALKSGNFSVTTDFGVIGKLDAVIICVPTPLYKTREPDVSYIVSAVRHIKKHMKRGQIIVLESTTYPGTTEEVMLPVLEGGGMKEGRDFYLAFSPERVDPGNPRYDTKNTPKIIGGISKESTELARALYAQAIDTIVPVSSAKVAEMVKLLENTFRIVNIGMVNELMLMCDRLGINVWEVIEAAKTKPYGFMPFYPGPGVGGHCLGKDERVFVKDRDRGGLRVVRISDFVEESKRDPGSRMHNFKGATFIRPEAKEVFSYDTVSAGPCFKEIGVLSERPYKGDMLDIGLADGRVFSVTPKHPVLVVREGTLGVKFADELVAGEEVPVMLGMPESQAAPDGMKIDMVEFLKGTAFAKSVRVKGRNFEWSAYQGIIREHALPGERDSIRDYIRDDYLPLGVYLSLEDKAPWTVTREGLLLVTGRGPSTQSVPAVMEIDEDFARFVGYYLSEGCITDDRSLRTRLTFNSGETGYINDVILFLKERGISYSIYRSKVWKSACIKISSSVFGLLLRDVLKCGVNSYTMKIPERFLLFPKRLKLNLLMGILRGDGGVDYSNLRRTYIKRGKPYRHGNNSASVNYFTSSDTLFDQVLLLLQDFGFVPTFKKRKNLLNIFGGEQLKRLKGMFLGEKAGKLGKYLSNKKRAVSNRSYRKCGDFAAVRIKGISHSRADKVYSMEVRDTNTFVTSYGVLTHNCIPVDPIYLSWKARMHGFEARFIDLASHVNSQMPYYVVSKVAEALNDRKTALKGAKVLVLGVAYKRDVKDLRESPALEIVELLAHKGADVSYHDPYLPFLKINEIDLKSVRLTPQALKAADCVVIVTDHTNVDYNLVAKEAKMIVDTRNVLKKAADRSNIVRL